LRVENLFIDNCDYILTNDQFALFLQKNQLMYRYIIRPLLFFKQPEQAHAITFGLLKALQKLNLTFLLKWIYGFEDIRLHRRVFGFDFPNPVGLAAGLDKDAEVIDALASVGFGFVEIGTVTPKAQPGNPKPRAFRLTNDSALINRMGFNNQGVDVCVEQLKNRKSNVIVGGNIGKNKVTPNEDAILDYQYAFEQMFEHVDYFVVNVSSPNTPNLRDLQEKEPLKQLLNQLQNLNNSKPQSKPILLKIAPDLTDTQLDDIIEIVIDTQIAGVVATNTTIAREPLSYDKAYIESLGAGGLSGKPLTKRSTEVIRYLHQKSNGKFPIIGVGGIFTAEDAIEKLEAGASLVQVYTGFIYQGPAIVKQINKKLLR